MPKKVYPEPTKAPLVRAAAPFDPRDMGNEEASIAAARAEPTPEKEPSDADTPSSSASASRSADGKEEDWQDEEWKEVYAALMEPTPEGAETPDCLADLGEFKRGKFCPSRPFRNTTELEPPYPGDEMKLIGGHDFFGEI